MPVPRDVAADFRAGEEDTLELLGRLIDADATELPDEIPGLFATRSDSNGDRLPPHWSIIARVDVRPQLARWFTPTTDWSYAPARSGQIGEDGPGLPSMWAAVHWSYGGVHSEGGSFNDLPPSGREVEVRGVTFLGPEGDEFVTRRVIDWIGVYGQLGLTVNWRIPL